MLTSAFCKILFKNAEKRLFYLSLNVSVGDRAEMKKPHPCGCKEFEILRIGMDFKIRCLGCGREVMVPRNKIEKNIKRILTDKEK